MEESSNIVAGAGSKVAGWLKAGLTSLAGLLGGAVLMYVSPLVNKVVAPPKPLANFEFQAKGLDVTFEDRSTGGHSGWWDFGDGTALVPFTPDRQIVQHKYAKPGSYSVKLSVKNLIDEENDRTVMVVLDGETTTTTPTIDTFGVVPVSGDYAPATFRVVSKVRDATLCVWVVGEQPIEVSPETANGSQEERFFTFKDPGAYKVRMAATNGKHLVEKAEIVNVKKPPMGTVTATVAVTYEAVQVDRRTSRPAVPISFPNGGVTFSQDFAPPAGFEFVTANFDAQTRYTSYRTPPTVQISPDKKKLTVSGELAQARPKNTTLNIPLLVTEQSVSPPALKTVDPVSMPLPVPGTTVVPLPALPQNWLATKRKITLALTQDGKEVRWKEGELPTNAAVQMSPNNMFVVTATEQGNQLRIDFGEVKLSIFGN
jgi:PKD repeat protein